MVELAVIALALLAAYVVVQLWLPRRDGQDDRTSTGPVKRQRRG